jgi:hypothetical protein
LSSANDDARDIVSNNAAELFGFVDALQRCLILD